MVGPIIILTKLSNCYFILFDDSFQFLLLMSKEVVEEFYSLRTVLCYIAA